MQGAGSHQVHVRLVHVVRLNLLHHLAVYRQRLIGALFARLPQDVTQSGITKHRNRNSNDGDPGSAVHSLAFLTETRESIAPYLVGTRPEAERKLRASTNFEKASCKSSAPPPAQWLRT